MIRSMLVASLVVAGSCVFGQSAAAQSFIWVRYGPPEGPSKPYPEFVIPPGISPAGAFTK